MKREPIDQRPKREHARECIQCYMTIREKDEMKEAAALLKMPLSTYIRWLHNQHYFRLEASRMTSEERLGL